MSNPATAIGQNFAFVRAEWPAVFAEAARAELNGVADPRTSCFYARRCLELTVDVAVLLRPHAAAALS